MLGDFSLTLPVSRLTRDRLLGIMINQQTLPVRLVIFGHPANVFLIRAEEGMAITLAGHFITGHPEPMDDVVQIPGDT